MAFKKTNTKNTSFTYDVLEECGTVATNDKGWEMKLRFMSWNGGEPKYDLRYWYTKDGEERSTKGITLTTEEIEGLQKLLNEIN